MSLLIDSASASIVLAKSWDLAGFDADAAAYIQRVEWADTTPLESATRTAINAFVIGCKADGIWTAIKASCILAGARTLAGALMPLVGAAPTNVGGLFVAGDYNRKTGLVGNRSTKYLSAIRKNNDDPQNNVHNAIYLSSAGTSGTQRWHLASKLNFSVGFNGIYTGGDNKLIVQNRTTSTDGSNSFPIGSGNAVGFIGSSRSGSANYTIRQQGTTNTSTFSSFSPTADVYFVFAGDVLGTLNFSDARIPFYSIGESLDLALLNTRVTDLINAFAAAIP